MYVYENHFTGTRRPMTVLFWAYTLCILHLFIFGDFLSKLVCKYYLMEIVREQEIPQLQNTDLSDVSGIIEVTLLF